MKWYLSSLLAVGAGGYLPQSLIVAALKCLPPWFMLWLNTTSFLFFFSLLHQEGTSSPVSPVVSNIQSERSSRQTAEVKWLFSLWRSCRLRRDTCLPRRMSRLYLYRRVTEARSMGLYNRTEMSGKIFTASIDQRRSTLVTVSGALPMAFWAVI